jgi:hypothetical protein
MYLQKVKPFLYLGIFYLIVSFLLRLVFVFHPITTADFSFAEILKVTSLGLVNDILVFTIASSFLALYFLFLSNGKYQKPPSCLELAQRFQRIGSDGAVCGEGVVDVGENASDLAE